VPRLNLREFQFAQTLIFALEEINNSSELLPGVSLGYSIHDTCGFVPLAVRAGLALMNPPEGLSRGFSCPRPPGVLGVVGESGSSPTIGLASVAGPFSIPVVRDAVQASWCIRVLKAGDIHCCS